jgi:glyoxylase-like metal-dependent hydrolase (beta-lactamase superfamily II)
MHKRKSIKRLALLLAFTLSPLLAAPLAAQQTDISFASSEVVPGLFMVTGVGGFGGGNMALMVGDEYVVMIDDGLAPLAPTLLAHVTETAGRPINFIINTHVHGDHAGGNAHFAGHGTVIFAHDNIRKRLLEDAAPAGGPAGLPVVTFAEGVTFHVNGMEARVMHMPRAHTDGDAVIHFPGVNVIHTGDIAFHGLFPFIDLANGGSVDGYIAAQQTILAMADEQTKIIPGHGPLTDREGLSADISMLTGARQKVAALVEQGMGEEEIVAANPLSDYHETYNWGFISTERMTRTLVADLLARQ